MFRSLLVGATSASLLAAGLQPAAATTAASEPTPQEVAVEVAEATEAALAEVGATGLNLDPFTGDATSASTGDGVTLDESSLTLAGVSDLTLTLPVDPTEAATVTAEGTLVLPSTEEGLHVEVQAIEGGTARVLTVAEASYSDTAAHEYVYGFSLPAGTRLVPDAEGGVSIVQDAVAVTETVTAGDLAAVDLDAVLPEVSDEDRASQADAVTAAGEGRLAGDQPVVVGALQSPWAVDANGAELPTRYEVRGDEIVQVVDTTGAEFPVVSDPLPLIGIALGAAARALVPHLIRAFAVQTIRVGAAFTTRGGYRSFDAFKAAAGRPNSGYQWHHIVEQSAGVKRGWSAYGINHPNNLVQIPAQVHQKCINSWMARGNISKFGVSTRAGERLRDAVHRESFSTQHRIGVELLRLCGVKV